MEYSETIPVQYQEGKTSFMGMEVAVDPRVLIPRPETELLVSVACDLLKEKLVEAPFVLDMGTGSGIIPLAITKEFSRAKIVGADISPLALQVAVENVEKFGRGDRIKLVSSDMFSFFKEGYEGRFDCIISNPPYVSKRDYEKLDAWVKAEPRQALYAGEEGMDHLNALLEESRAFIKSGGFLAVEIGYDQADKVKSKFTSCGFSNISTYKDFNDYERVIVGWKHG